MRVSERIAHGNERRCRRVIPIFPVAPVVSVLLKRAASYAYNMRPTIKEPPAETGLTEALAQRQRRTEEFLGRIRAQTDAAKQGLFSQIERILEQIEGEKAECRGMKEELLAKSEELRRQMEIVGRFRDDFARWQEQREAACQKAIEQQVAVAERIDQQQALLDEKLAGLKQFQSELDQREEGLRRAQRETALAQQDFDAQRQYLEEKQTRLNERLAELEVEREELAVARKKTADQRRKLAAAVKAKRVAPTSGAEQAPAGSSGDKTAEANEEAFLELEARRRELEEELQAARNDLSRQSEELDDLVREKIELIQRLDSAEQRGAENEEGSQSDFEGERSELLGEIERLQGENEELRREIESLQEAPAAATRAPARGAVAMDWESQKAQLLASLEVEGDDVSTERAKERTRIADVVRRTDAAIEEKDREIEELTALLQQRTENVGAVAVGAAAVGEVLDKDEVIAQERARLEELKKEWEAKLRQAEVEISLERASLARERQILAESLAKQHHGAKGHGPGEGKGAETSRKKWMSALGLSDEDDGHSG